MISLKRCVPVCFASRAIPCGLSSKWRICWILQRVQILGESSRTNPKLREGVNSVVNIFAVPAPTSAINSVVNYCSELNMARHITRSISITLLFVLCLSINTFAFSPSPVEVKSQLTLGSVFTSVMGWENMYAPLLFPTAITFLPQIQSSFQPVPTGISLKLQMLNVAPSSSNSANYTVCIYAGGSVCIRPTKSDEWFNTVSFPCADPSHCAFTLGVGDAIDYALIAILASPLWSSNSTLDYGK